MAIGHEQLLAIVRALAAERDRYRAALAEILEVIAEAPPAGDVGHARRVARRALEGA